MIYTIFYVCRSDVTAFIEKKKKITYTRVVIIQSSVKQSFRDVYWIGARDGTSLHELLFAFT